MRKLAGVAIPFSAAVFAAVYLAPDRALPWLALVCVPAALLALLLPKDRRLGTVLAALGLAAGFLWAWGYQALFLAPAQALDGGEGGFTAQILDWPRETDYGVSLTVRLRPESGGSFRAILYTGKDLADLAPGDQVRGRARFRRADRLGGEESSYHYAKGITLLAYGRGTPEVAQAEAIPLRFWPLVASRAVREQVARVFPADTAGFLSALLTGDSASMDETVSAAFRRTGLAHVVAVSGLHVVFLAGLLATLLGRGPVAAGATILLLLFFALAAGAAPSVLRAVYLQSTLMAAPLLGRENDRVTSLSASLMLLLLWNPWAAADVGLQLSFGAVAGIYLVTGPLYSRWTKDLGRGLRAGLVRFGAGNLSTSLGALLFTTPIMAYHFGQISLVAPVANLLTLWAVSGVFLGGAAIAALSVALPGVGQALAWVLAWLVRGIQWMAQALARFPFASVSAGGYLGLWLGFVYLLLLLWGLWRRERKGPLLPVAAAVLALCAALLLNTLTLRGGDLRVTVLDVGQGASILLHSKGQSALVDCGGSSPGGSGDAAADAVQALGTDRLDYLVLTHFHADHANGVERLMARLDVRTLIVPDTQPDDPLRARILALAQEEGAQIRFLTDDTWVPLGETTLSLYAPLGDGGANEEGLSVLATCGEFDALMTGDMNAAVERRLIKYHDLPDIELLVAGHHGSAYSSSEELLLATRPEYAVISVGYNSYGHPAPETLERLGAAGCEIYRTDWMGAVSITANREGD